MKSLKRIANHLLGSTLLSLCFCAIITNIANASEDENISQKLFTAGRIDRCIELTKHSTSDQPDFVKSQILMATANFVRCHYQESISDVNKVFLSAKEIHLDDESNSILLALRGACYDRLGMYDKALADFTTASKIPGCPPEIINSRELAKQKLKNPAALNESAQVSFQQQLEMAKDQSYGIPLVEISLPSKFPGKGSKSKWQNAIHFGQEAQSLEAENNLNKAIENYQDAVALYTYEPWLYSSLALCYITRKDYEDGEKAIEAFKNALSLNDSNWRLWNDLGAILYREHALTDAKRAFEMALSKGKDIDSAQKLELVNCIKTINSALVLKNQMNQLQKTGELKFSNGAPNPNEMPNEYYVSPTPLK